EAVLLAVLVHVEEQARLLPDPIRRLAILGGAPEVALRLSKEQKKRLEQIGANMSHAEAAYRFGTAIGMDRLAIEAASLGREIDTDTGRSVQEAASQVFPLTAADLMPVLKGAALGKALKTAEARWIASGFTLTKADLLD
ncbi:MAG: CCA tRNA nucleotidyltransferase, partial [Pseudomonadota bacterium]